MEKGALCTACWLEFGHRVKESSSEKWSRTAQRAKDKWNGQENASV